jgi:CRISPR/Cas system-associated exonuclease Cas4 (RecB family)
MDTPLRWWHRDAADVVRFPTRVLGIAVAAVGWSNLDDLSSGVWVVLLVIATGLLATGLALLVGHRHRVLGYGLAIAGALLLPVGLGVVVTVVFLAVTVSALAVTVAGVRRSREVPG